MVNRQLAEQLRREGKTYRQISEIVGCSEIWCKQNLKHIETVSHMTNEQLWESIKNLIEEAEKRVKNGV